MRGAIGGIGKLTLCNEIGWGQTEVKRDVFSLSLVLAGLGFVGYVVLTLKQKQPPATQPVTVPEAVLPSILTELDQRIRVRDGFIVVTEEPGVDTFLLPVSSQWLVRCGEGASIQLGAAANGSAGILRNEVNVMLFNSLIDKNACAIVAPRVAAKLEEKLAGR